MKIELITIVSALTVACSYGIKLIGFPEQIQKIRKSKSTAGLSKSIFIFSFFSYCSWVLYGFLKGDMIIVAAQSLGVVVGGITLFYMWKYRK